MPRYEPFDWYETPIYYDIVFEEGTQQEADFLEAAMRQYAHSGGQRVLEPACGSGRLLIELARRGYEVTGFDLSERMIDFARCRLGEAGVEGDLSVGRMEAFRYPRRFDMAFCLVSSFKYLLTEDDAHAHLRCMAEALESGGIYALGLHLSEYGDDQISRERWVGRRDGIEVVCNIQGWPADPRTRTERVRSRLVVNENGATRRYETEWHFRTYDLDQLYKLLDGHPEFELAATHNFLYRIDEPIPLDGSYLDNLLILRRR